MVTQASRDALRASVADWVRIAVERTEYTPAQIEGRLGLAPGWLFDRTRPRAISGISLGQLHQLARLLGRPVPIAVQNAALQLEVKPTRPQQRVDAKPEADLLARCRSAAEEMECLLRIGAAARPAETQRRDLAAVLARYGVRQPAATPRAIGERLGVTTERARQIETIILDGAERAAVARSLHFLEALERAVEKSAGTPVPVVEARLVDVLGDVPLVEALRFLYRIRPERERTPLVRQALSGKRAVPIVGATEDANGRIKALDTAARRLSERFGAFTVEALAAQASFEGPRTQLLAWIGALPEVQWLDERRRWLALPSNSWLARRVCLLLAVARGPLELASVYQGVEREAKRPITPGRPTTPHLPPPDIFAQWLAEQRFARIGSSGEVWLVTPTDPAELLSAAACQFIADLDARGGVAARRTMIRQTLARGLVKRNAVEALFSYARVPGNPRGWGVAATGQEHHPARSDGCPTRSGRRGRWSLMLGQSFQGADEVDHHGRDRDAVAQLGDRAQDFRLDRQGRPLA